jgi:hypothetical protein
VDLGGQVVDRLRQVSIDVQFLLALDEVVVCLRLLECRLPVLADHHERRQEDRLQRDDQGERRPWTLLEDDHPHDEHDGVQVHERHGARERGDRVSDP